MTCNRFLISGYFGYSNPGDEAILTILLKDIRDAAPGAEIYVLSGNPEATTQQHAVQAILPSNLKSIIHYAAESDGLIVGGGGVFQDYWGVRKETLLTPSHAGIPYYSSLPILGRLLDKPVLIHAVGVGPLFGKEAKELTRLSFKLGKLTSVRDSDSQSLLASLGLLTKNILITADPAFRIIPNREKATAILNNLPLNPSTPRVAVCLRHWEMGKSTDQWQTQVAKALDAFVNKTGSNLLFLPFQHLPESLLTDDPAFTRLIMNLMKHADQGILLENITDPTILAGLLAECDLTVGMRYHAVVFSALAGVPIIALAYDPKVSHVMKDLGMEEYAIPLTGLSSEGLLKYLDEAWNIRNKLRSQVNASCRKMKERAFLNHDIITEFVHLQVKNYSRESSSFFKELSLNQALLLSEKQETEKGLRNLISEYKTKNDELLERISEKDTAISILSARVEVQEKKIEFESIRSLDAEKIIGAQEKILIRTNHERIKLTKQVNKLLSQIGGLQTETKRLETQVTEKDDQAQALTHQLREIQGSRGWKLLVFLWDLRKNIMPRGSRLEVIAREIWRSMHKERIRKSKELKLRLQASLQNMLAKPLDLIKEEYKVEDNTHVTLYTDDTNLKPSYPNRCSLLNNGSDRLHVSLISSVKNESKNVSSWIDGIQGQTRLPDEIILVDGGSTDGTVARLDAFAKISLIPVQVLKTPGANIAQARNLATNQAKHPIIAVTDFGCQPDPNWLKNLIYPFIIEPETQVSAGFYRSVDRKGNDRSGNGIWPGIQDIDPQSFLPSSRSVAFKKTALQAVGGHPEWLTMTGDDTYLDLELKRMGGKWAFVPEALVTWVIPDTLSAQLRKMYQWAIGDGESSVHARYYWQYGLRWFLWMLWTILVAISMIVVLVLKLYPVPVWMSMGIISWLSPLCLLMLKEKLSPQKLIQKGLNQGAQVLGFIKGARRRGIITHRKIAQAKGLFIILSGVPIDDTGGGARGTQITQALLYRGWSVIFLNMFERDEIRNLHLQYCHTQLYLSSFKKFQLNAFLQEHPYIRNIKPIFVLLEFPHPDFLPLLDLFQDELGAKLIYDRIDDWNTSLGAKWYSPEIEGKIVHKCDHLVATLPILARPMEKSKNQKILILPNAVNEQLFKPLQEYSRPVDMPSGDRFIIYVGALWGDWFDWKLLAYMADSNPNIEFIIIGDYRGQSPDKKLNIHFLGLKAQKELPAYLAYSDVGLLPWKVSDVTQTTSPLKVYEYLAMGLPVVAPDLKPLLDMPGVQICKTYEEFSKLTSEISRSNLNTKEISQFICNHTWGKRIEELLAHLNRTN